MFHVGPCISAVDADNTATTFERKCRKRPCLRAEINRIGTDRLMGVDLHVLLHLYDSYEAYYALASTSCFILAWLLRSLRTHNYSIQMRHDVKRICPMSLAHRKERPTRDIYIMLGIFKRKRLRDPTGHSETCLIAVLLGEGVWNLIHP